MSAEDLRKGSATMQERKSVKLIVIGGKSQVVDIAAEGSVRDALSAAKLAESGYSIRAGGRDVELDEVVENGTKLVLGKAIQGNHHRVIRR